MWQDAAVHRLVEQLDPLRTDRIDYIEWSNTLRLEDLPTLTRCVSSPVHPTPPSTPASQRPAQSAIQTMLLSEDTLTYPL